MKFNIHQVLTIITLSQFGKTQAAVGSAIATETSTTSTETTTTSTLVVQRTYTRHLTSTWDQSYTTTTTGPISLGATHVTVFVDVPSPYTALTDTTTTSTDTTTTSTLIIPKTYTRHLTSTWDLSYTTTTTGPISSGATHVTVYVDVPSSVASESTVISKSSSIAAESQSSSSYATTSSSELKVIGTETTTTSTETTTTSTLIIPRTYTRHLTSTWDQSYTTTTTGPISSGATHVTVYVDVPGVASSSESKVIATETTTTSTETTTTSTLIIPRTYTRHLTSTWDKSYTTTTTGPISSGATHVTVYVDVPSSVTPISTVISGSSTISAESYTFISYATSSSSEPKVIGTGTITTSTETTTTSTLIIPTTYTRHLTSTWDRSYTTTTTGPISSGATHVTVYVDVPSSKVSTSAITTRSSSLAAESYSSIYRSILSSSQSAIKSSDKPSQIFFSVSGTKSSNFVSLSTVITPTSAKHSSISSDKSRTITATMSKSSYVESPTYSVVDTSSTNSETVSSTVISKTILKTTTSSEFSSFTTLVLATVSSSEAISASAKDNATSSSNAFTRSYIDTTSGSTPLPITSSSPLSFSTLPPTTTGGPIKLQSISTDKIAISNANSLTYTDLYNEETTTIKYAEKTTATTPTSIAFHTIVSDSDYYAESTVIELETRTTIAPSQTAVFSKTLSTSTTLVAISNASTSATGANLMYEGNSNKNFASFEIVIACLLAILSLI